MNEEEAPFELVLAPPAVRAIQQALPEAVATAVLEFATGALVRNPRRVGTPLRGELAGIYSARRGTYRVLYRINDADHDVVVLRIEHRRDAYRAR
ncbi:type II toxin-antitoxin system RelE/ParE family toxin [Pseudactinotalea sp. HY158]|uniref:type II toxin-antitoxin system RelE family toxin n=1 Tax=Pseudactinotalea sp. HY158 TaxID=2654547 RepID=UPI0018926DB8|nr:type II toxin-antitoxin system RelE/ParE family toxin [Pseudactinotalea sp. HY158]